MTDPKKPAEIADAALDEVSAGLNPSRTYKLTNRDAAGDGIIAVELDAGRKVIEYQDGDDLFLR